ncbi:dTDP-4-dehydrorhamnose 3,5-epimerase [Anaerobacterium chartisolvens]|uniref:dTDP-4-dehydrorhamnose 3,5-epimerase n=1 Tax=Anaerobacterium chartisolvens TaxID=1297424 RepID=A0A369ANJ0_9FIRM|nr:dTDP-4-dehydrorhamnose 3,5-epimerase [Anaerobacterium chartisolvens]RCX09888.1 dTDP-4-dehydrorhamnose 3,5-epimerase [Anaerobacterium chartisolvens]
MYSINKTPIEGCFEFTPGIFTDNRGVSIKPYNVDILKSMGVGHGFAEDLMVTSRKGVLRGLHFQRPPYAQAKLIWCVRGSIFDVAVDIRKNSPTYGSFVYFHIDCIKHNIAYIPAGLAHGYQVLEEDTTVFYKMSSVYSPENEGGILYNSLGIAWPLDNPIISEKDLSLPDFKDFVNVF